MRTLCETIFNILLLSYITTLKAFREECVATLGQPGVTELHLASLVCWDQAIELAEKALARSQDAEALRQNGSIDDADAMSGAAFEALNDRYVLVTVSKFNFPTS